MKTVLPLLALVAPIAACSVMSSEDTGSNGAYIETAAPLKPVDLLRCWIAADTEHHEFFQVHSLECERTVQDAYPLVPDEVTVRIRTARGTNTSRPVTDAETRVGTFANGDFPLTVLTTLRFAESSTLGKQTYLNRQDQLDSLAAATKDKPLVYASPFTLWGVALRAQKGGAINITSSYEVPTAAFRVVPDGFATGTWDNIPSSLNVQAFASANDGRVELAFVAPPTGGIAVAVNGWPFEIAGPGAYVFGSDKVLRKEGEVEGANDGAAKGPAPGPDLVEPSPNPACGTDGLAACPDGKCAPSHQLKADVCRACGTDGKPYCGTSYEKKCDAGHRVVADVCRACGSDGQTYCGTGYDKACDAGHRVVADVCRACGGDGQTYCGTGYEKTCDAGHRVVADVCRACGGEGQTYCGTGFEKKCNDGLRLSYDNCVR